MVHEAVKALKDERRRADFEVYLKKFLASLDIVLPNVTAQPYRVPARRFGYLLEVAKQRYKDASLDLGDAGEKVKALINEHLVSLGIDTKIAPVELLAEDFLDKLAAHADGNSEAKASEMEHALRKHCTVHHDEDPAFYQRLSDKVDALIEQHQGQWDLLAEKLTTLRAQAIAGREDGDSGMSKEATIFHEHLAQIGFADGVVPPEHQEGFQTLMETAVEILQESIVSIDFWQNPDKQKRVRGLIKNEIAKTGIDEVKQHRERVAVEIMKLAKNRHDDLLRQGGRYASFFRLQHRETPALAAVAQTYPQMLAFRFLSGLPHGAYFGVAALVAAALVPVNKRTQAVGKVMLGLTVATLVGTPLAA